MAESGKKCLGRVQSVFLTDCIRLGTFYCSSQGEASSYQQPLWTCCSQLCLWLLPVLLRFSVLNTALTEWILNLSQDSFKNPFRMPVFSCATWSHTTGPLSMYKMPFPITGKPHAAFPCLRLGVKGGAVLQAWASASLSLPPLWKMWQSQWSSLFLQLKWMFGPF